MLAHFLNFINQLSRHLSVFEGHALIGLIPEYRLVFNQVDNTLEVLFRTDSHLQRHRHSAQTILQLADYLAKVCACAIHLVNEYHTWHFVFVGLAPYSLGLRLNTRGATQNHDSTIKHTQ